MEDQLTFRIPRTLARALARKAKARGVPRSQLVREAVTRYMEEPEGPTAEELYERSKKYIGIIKGPPDPDFDLAEHIYKQNFRE